MQVVRLAGALEPGTQRETEVGQIHGRLVRIPVRIRRDGERRHCRVMPGAPKPGNTGPAPPTASNWQKSTRFSRSGSARQLSGAGVEVGGPGEGFCECLARSAVTARCRAWTARLAAGVSVAARVVPGSMQGKHSQRPGGARTIFLTSIDVYRVVPYA